MIQRMKIITTLMTKLS